MQLSKFELNLPEGTFLVDGIKFEDTDAKQLTEIYDTWRKLSDLLKLFHSRKPNLPGGLSESAVCLAKGLIRVTGRISGAKSSFDCYDPNASAGNNRIQVKACSVIPDLTSFGPKSVWDRIFFTDFHRNGNWDKTFDIYEIDTETIYNTYVNETETFREQALQKRRPRFSIYDTLVLSSNYISKESYEITADGIVQI